MKRVKLTNTFSKELLSVLQVAIDKISNAMVDAYQDQLPSFENLELLLEGSSSFHAIINNLSSTYIKETSKTEKNSLINTFT